MDRESQLIWEAYQPEPGEGLDDPFSDIIDGKLVTVTIPEVIEYLDKNKVLSKSVDVNKLKHIIIPPKNPERTGAAKLIYPIIVTIGLEGKYKNILDGNHRLQKAIDRGDQTIKVRELDLRTAPKSFQQLLNFSVG